MKSFLFSCLVLFSSVVSGVDIKENFLQHLSARQTSLLNDFLMTVTHSTSAYVLFGDKPMDIQTCDISSLRILSGMNPRSVILVKGKELWQDLGLSPHNKEYALSIFTKDNVCHLVCINRKAFLQAVQSNITLFRYILGPGVTAEGLLHELVASKSGFYQVLKDNHVLLSILLGHGAENAILQSRYEELSFLFGPNPKDEFPFIPKNASKAWAVLPKQYAKEPSTGFHSIPEEEMSLERALVFSDKVKPFDSLEIPHFSCALSLQETKDLLSLYEDNRKKIQKALGSKTLFQDVLRKFFTTASQTLEVPPIPQEKSLSLPSNKEETVVKIVELIHKTIGPDAKKFLSSFMKGVTARESGQKVPEPHQWKGFKHLDQLEKELECCKNLERANAYFKRLSERKDLVCLAPEGLYYKTLKEGNESKTSTKLKKASFQYSMQILGDVQTRDWGIVKQENIGSFIPGVAYALFGMADGEERVIYIHPKYAYGENSFYPPNVAIVAQVRLLNFEQGDQEVAIFPPHQLEQRDYKDLLTRVEVLRAEAFFDEGVAFWDRIKKCGDFIDFQSFKKVFNTTADAAKSFPNANVEQQFVSDLEYYLLSLQKGARDTL